MDEDEQFNQAFGEHTDISVHTRRKINGIRDNDPDVNYVKIRSDDTDVFTRLAWTLLGRYIANSIQLTSLVLDNCSLTNEKMILLFSELVGSESLQSLDLDGNAFGIDGVRRMTSFLQNSPDFANFFLGENQSINTECFEVLISALNGMSIKMLDFKHCNITGISALSTYNLPNLQRLGLTGNNIDREGCIILSNLLQKEDSTLTRLYLSEMGLGDEEAELLATSLKHNIKLEVITLANNYGITERGHVAFLKLLNDVTSIENTYNSNHTLTYCALGSMISGSMISREKTEVLSLIEAAFLDNERSRNPGAAGKAKVIRSHLNSQTLKKHCQLQGIEYSHGNLFADIEPVLLPKVLALIRREHGRSEFYSSLSQVAPDLMSFINRKAILEEERAKNSSRAAILRQQADALIRQASIISAKNDQIDKRLALIELGDSKQTDVVGGGKEGGGGEKRQRIN